MAISMTIDKKYKETIQEKEKQTIIEMNKNNYHSFEYYSFLPYKKNTFKKLGDFEFFFEKGEYGSLAMYVHYSGNNVNFDFINNPIDKSGTKYYYGGKPVTILKDDKKFTRLTYIYSISRNYTYSSTSFISSLEVLKKDTTFIIKDSPDIKKFKKEVAKDKKIWEDKRKEAIEKVFEVTYEKYLEDKNQIINIDATQLVLKLAPMLNNLKDECECLIKQLNTSSGPSKQAKINFVDAYKAFQKYHKNKTFLYAVKTLNINKKKK